jgi:hypothetical protein
MNKVTEAKSILKEVGMPSEQQTDIAAYALLTLADIAPDSNWNSAHNEWIRIHDVLQFASEKYGRTYAENTRETVRKSCMHQFREGALIEDNGKATNSPNYRYRITPEFLETIQHYGSSDWKRALTRFTAYHERLIDIYASKKKMQMMPVYINGQALKFSPGRHNELQRAIIEQFAPRFAPHSECLYVGDTIKKDLIKNVEKLSALGFTITLHDKMPDVVLYRPDKDWLYFIEAVASVGPMSPQRIIEINAMTKNVKSGKVFVTAFPDFDEYKKFSSQIAWETEVWIANAPDHMIHLNGNKFLGPRN